MCERLLDEYSCVLLIFILDGMLRFLMKIWNIEDSSLINF